MKEPDKFRENAANCAMLAKDAKHGPAGIRYKRMEPPGCPLPMSRIG